MPPISGPNSSKPTTGEVVAGVYNVTLPVLVDGQACPIQLDVNGQIKTSGGGGATSNVNITGINGVAPSLTNALAVELSDGTNPLGTDANPIRNSPSSTAAVQPVSGTVTVVQPTGTNLHTVVDSGAITATTNADTTIGGTVAPIKELLVAGKTNDGTPQYQPIPEGTGGRSVIVEGVAGGTAVPVSGSVTASGTVTANQGTPAATTAGWPYITGDVAESTAAWTSATGSNTAVTMTVKNYNTIILTLNQGTTITGGVVTFEVSDTTAFTNAYTIFGVPVNALLAANPLSTYTLVASTNQAFTFDVSGWAAFRVRLSTVISGSATVNVGVAANAGAVPHSLFAKVDLNTASYFNSNLAGVVSNGGATDGTTAAGKFGGTGGGGSLGGVSLFAATGPASTAANNVSVRTPNFFKTSTATNFGNTAVWTPTSGKKFRLMRYQIELTENATLAVAALLTVKFQDATTDFGFQHDEFVPAAAGAVAGEAWRSGWIDLDNGYLSAAANNVLNFNISGAANLTAGLFRINVAGTEE